MRSDTTDVALRESEERFRSAFDSARVGFAVSDLDGRLRAVNRTICDMLGYTEAELMGMRRHDLSHPDDRANGAELFRQLLNGECETARVKKRYIHKDGHAVWVSVNASLMRDAADTPPYLVIEVMDLHPRHEAERALARSTALLRESEERFRCAFEGAATGFALIELDGSIRAANYALCEMFGYTAEEMLQKTFPTLSHPDDAARTLPQRDELVAGEKEHFNLEKRYIHKDGSVIWAVAALSIVRLSAVTPYFVGQLTDITKRKAMEDELTRHSANLERSNAELESFAYVASHDLQQPLRAVTSYSTLLADRYKGTLDARAERWIGHIQNGVDYMQRMISDLLQLSRLRTDGDGFEPTDMDGVTRRIWDMLGSQHQIDGSIAIGVLPAVMADEAQMELLMKNLMDNAYRYRRRDVPLLLKVNARHLTEGTREKWEFTIGDNGIGFESRYADRIFEMSRRLHSADIYEGTGIGLTICRRIVERHGGRIWAESVVGAGSTFHFTLPDRPLVHA